MVQEACARLGSAPDGLDETEAFNSQIAGIIESIHSNHYPLNLETITFIERSSGRANRLQQVLEREFQGGYISTDAGRVNSREMEIENIFSDAYDSNTKKHIFVAMPFSKAFDNIYYYGIKNSVDSIGGICERADHQEFTGDVMDWVKSRISKADLIIADLTGANPNVYLELGFAWGKNKKTVLLINNPDELKFDTKGQRCLAYDTDNIKNLETKLTNELKKLQF